MATAVFASWLPPGQWGDTDMTPLNGGRVFIYQAGTSTPDTSYPTYNDALAGTNANTNPVNLDVSGFGQIWLQSGRLYKIIVQRSVAAGGAQVGPTIDNYNPAAAQQYPALDQWVRETTTPAFLTTTSLRFAGIDLTARYVAGRRIMTQNSGGTVFATVASSAFSLGNTNVVIATDSGVLDAGLSSVYYCLTTPPGQGTAPPGIGDRTSFISVYLSANQAILTGADRKIQFDTEISDLLAEYDNATNFRWTPLYQSSSQWNKRYLHTINVTLDTSIVSAQLMLYRNGAAIQRWTQNHGIAGGTLHASWIENQQASTGNFYEIFVNPSANVNVRGGITATTWQVTAIP